MRPRVLVTRKLPSEEALQELSKYCEVHVRDSPVPPSKEELKRAVAEYDAVLCYLTDRFDSEVLEHSERLKVMSSCSTGVDHIDLETATRHGIYVCNSPDPLSEATAEFTWALIFALARRVVEADREVREGRWKVSWSPDYMLGMSLKGKVLGVVGLGRIGKEVARIGKCLGMKVIYYSRTRKPDVEKELGIEYKSLDDLLREADIVTIHVPLTKETYHMINEEKLKLMKMMKRTALLINTARGQVIDTQALIKALENGWIAGAALDVFEQEPLPPEHPLTKFRNVILTPHIGSATVEHRAIAAKIAVDNILRLFRGEVPQYLVNPDVIKIRPPGELKVL